MRRLGRKPALTAPVTVSSGIRAGGRQGRLHRRDGRPRARRTILPLAPLSPYEMKAGSPSRGPDHGPQLRLAGAVDRPGHRAGLRPCDRPHRADPAGRAADGPYDSQVGYGQNRLLLVWTRLIYPSGRSVELGAMIAADATGASGLADKVDTHLPVLARAIGLSTLISIGGTAAQNGLSRGSDNLVLQDGAGGIAAQASQTGQRLVERDLQRSPTLRVRPGFRVRVMVDKDLILPPEVEARR
jgi:hypothetical protein